MSSIPSTLRFHSNGGTYPPHGNITPYDHGAYVVVTAWIFMCFTVLSLLARLGTRRALSKDNVVITVAAVISILQSVTVHIAVNYGLGRHRTNIRDTHYVTYSKAKYAGQILEIIVLCLAKISLMMVFMNLTPSRPVQLVLRLCTTAFILWGVAAAFALAFQCQRPNPWDLTPSRCMNEDVIYYSNGVTNIITDLIIILLPVIIVWKVQIKRKQKAAIIAIFAVRGLVCISTIIQLNSLRPYIGASDQTWLDTVPSIWTQVTINLSIITACIPLMKPFLEKLQFSLVDSSIPFRSGLYAVQLQTRDQNTGVC